MIREVLLPVYILLPFPLPLVHQDFFLQYYNSFIFYITFQKHIARRRMKCENEIAKWVAF